MIGHKEKDLQIQIPNQSKFRFFQKDRKKYG
jgi:hypothetical protein